MTGDARPHVVIASRLFAPEVGAAAFRLKAVADALDAAGADVSILTTVPPRKLPAQRFPYALSRWPVLRDRGGNVRGYVQYASFDIPLIFRLLVTRGFDAVVVEPPPTTGAVVALVCRLRRRPMIYFSGDVSSVAAKGIGVSRIGLAVLTHLERAVLRSATAVLTVSEGVRAEVLALTGPRDAINDVGTGVDTSVFAMRPEVATPPGRYFVYAGTMSEIQGAGVFVDAFLSIADDFPDVTIEFFGQGVEVEELMRRSATHRSQVHFNAPIPGEDVARWMSGAVANCASVRPSRGYDFAFATKALAGLAAGSPCIYAGVGPVGPLVRDNDLGWACSWDKDEVAAAMRAALEAPVTLERRHRIAAWVEDHHSLRAVGERAATIVLELVGRRRALHSSRTPGRAAAEGPGDRGEPQS